MSLFKSQNNAKENDEYVLPSSSNLKKQELFFLKGCMIFLIVAIIYMYPYRIFQPVQEAKGFLQNIEECYSSSQGTGASYLTGLHLTIDNQIYFLKREYIFDDGSQHAVKGVMPMKNALQKVKEENQEVVVSYIKYAHVGAEVDADIVGMEIANEIWINTNNSREVFRYDVILHTAICIIALLILVVVYLLRCGVIKVSRFPKV